MCCSVAAGVEDLKSRPVFLLGQRGSVNYYNAHNVQVASSPTDRPTDGALLACSVPYGSAFGLVWVLFQLFDQKLSPTTTTLWPSR